MSTTHSYSKELHDPLNLEGTGTEFIKETGPNELTLKMRIVLSAFKDAGYRSKHWTFLPPGTKSHSIKIVMSPSNRPSVSESPVVNFYLIKQYEEDHIEIGKDTNYPYTREAAGTMDLEYMLGCLGYYKKASDSTTFLFAPLSGNPLDEGVALRSIWSPDLTKYITEIEMLTVVSKSVYITWYDNPEMFWFRYLQNFTIPNTDFKQVAIGKGYRIDNSASLGVQNPAYYYLTGTPSKIRQLIAGPGGTTIPYNHPSVFSSSGAIETLIGDSRTKKLVTKDGVEVYSPAELLYSSLFVTNQLTSPNVIYDKATVLTLSYKEYQECLLATRGILIFTYNQSREFSNDEQRKLLSDENRLIRYDTIYSRINAKTLTASRNTTFEFSDYAPAFDWDRASSALSVSSLLNDEAIYENIGYASLAMGITFDRTRKLSQRQSIVLSIGTRELTAFLTRNSSYKAKVARLTAAQYVSLTFLAGVSRKQRHILLSVRIAANQNETDQFLKRQIDSLLRTSLFHSKNMLNSFTYLAPTEDVPYTVGHLTSYEVTKALRSLPVYDCVEETIFGIFFSKQFTNKQMWDCMKLIAWWLHNNSYDSSIAAKRSYDSERLLTNMMFVLGDSNQADQAADVAYRTSTSPTPGTYNYFFDSPTGNNDMQYMFGDPQVKSLDGFPVIDYRDIVNATSIPNLPDLNVNTLGDPFWRKTRVTTRSQAYRSITEKYLVRGRDGLPTAFDPDPLDKYIQYFNLASGIGITKTRYWYNGEVFKTPEDIKNRTFKHYTQNIVVDPTDTTKAYNSLNWVELFNSWGTNFNPGPWAGSGSYYASFGYHEPPIILLELYILQSKLKTKDQLCPPMVNYNYPGGSTYEQPNVDGDYYKWRNSNWVVPYKDHYLRNRSTIATTSGQYETIMRSVIQQDIEIFLQSRERYVFRPPTDNYRSVADTRQRYGTTQKLKPSRGLNEILGLTLYLQADKLTYDQFLELYNWILPPSLDIPESSWDSVMIGKLPGVTPDDPAYILQLRYPDNHFPNNKASKLDELKNKIADYVITTNLLTINPWI